MAGTKLRDLFVRLGFEVDPSRLDAVDRSINNTLRSAKQLSVFMAAGSAAIGFFVKEAGEFEQVEIAFETMLGSAEKAKELLVDLEDFAKTTPFTMPGILNASKSLIAFGVEQEKIVGTMESLGNIAAGVGKDKLPTLVRAFGKIRVKGRASMEELNMLLEAGVPILDELAKNYDVSNEALFKMISAGEVGFGEVDAALRNLSSGSGLFANLMERQSKSFFGILSNIQDVLLLLSKDIGQKLLPQAKAMAKRMLDFVEANKKLIKVKAIKFFEELSKLLGKLFKIVMQLGDSVLFVVNAFGGLANVIKTVVFALLAFTAMNILSALGNMAILVFNVAKAFKAVGIAANIATISGLLMPILIGAAIIALGLLIEDLIAFFQGKESITGLILDTFAKKFPIAFAVTKMALDDIIQGFKFWFDIAKTTINGVIDMLASLGKALLSPLDSLEGLAKFIGFGDSGIGDVSPSSAPVRNSSTQSSIKVNAPIEVNVPPGTPAEEVGSAVQLGVEGALERVFRETRSAVEPQVI